MYLGFPGDVDEVCCDQDSRHEADHPHGREVLVPGEILAQPADRVRVLVLSPVLTQK